MPPCSKMMEFHYSFDYAQQVSLSSLCATSRPLILQNSQEVPVFLAFVQKDQVCSVFFILTIEMSQNVVIMYVLISFLMFQYCIIVRLCTSDI